MKEQGYKYIVYHCASVGSYVLGQKLNYENVVELDYYEMEDFKDEGKEMQQLLKQYEDLNLKP